MRQSEVLKHERRLLTSLPGFERIVIRILYTFAGQSVAVVLCKSCCRAGQKHRVELRDVFRDSIYHRLLLAASAAFRAIALASPSIQVPSRRSRH